MSGKTAHIHLQQEAVPKAKHRPIPVPYHLKDPVRQAIMQDTETSAHWHSYGLVQHYDDYHKKKDGRPRLTIVYQYLNPQCKRENHHTATPFQLAMQAPPNTKKTVLDAVDGYHSVILDEESQPLTTFITEWGRFMYLRVPGDYLASVDTYTHRYDEVIKGIARKIELVDDT